jgi:hypothetical protein
MTLEGIDPQKIGYHYKPVPPELTEKSGDTVPDPVGRVRTGLRKWVVDHISDDPEDFEWRYWRNIDYEHLRWVFSEEEIVKLWMSDFIMSKAGEYIEKNDFLVWKVSNSHHRYGWAGKDYNLLCRHLDGLRALQAPEGFEIRLTYSTAFNPVGRAYHCSRYLFIDGTFALLFYYKGEHVLTCGFAAMEEGIALTQVQLREKKGNRWLFKIPGSLVDTCLGILARAFPSDPLWIIDGESAVKGIRTSYGKEPCTMTAEDEKRIIALYNQPLVGYSRTSETLQLYQGRVAVKLARASEIEKKDETVST